MPIISIIVPVYKVELYLSKCIDSILAQTFSDFELILVDDGSPDRCGEICDAYAQKDKRVCVIHKENGGLSSARNAGIDIANGNYIGFIDSDDYIDLDMYEFLYMNIKKYNAGIAACGLYNCYGSDVIAGCDNCYSSVVDSVQAITYAFKGKLMTVNAVNKLYKREIFDTLRYPIGKTTEDGFLIVEVLLKALLIHVDTTPKYYYVHRVESITTGIFGAKDLCVLEAYQRNLEIIQNNCPQIEPIAYFSLWWAYRYLLNRLAMQSKQIRLANILIIKDSTNVIRRDIKRILSSREVSIFQKLAYVTVGISPYLYMCTYKTIIKFNKKSIWRGRKNE